LKGASRGEYFAHPNRNRSANLLEKEKLEMKRISWKMIILLLAGLFVAATAAAAEMDGDIAGDPLSGPGSISLMTKGNIMMSFGARVRMIPTSETDWDFGFQGSLEGDLLGGALSSAFFKQHANESGWVAENYIRNETQIYLNALPEDRKWSFHAALEFDRPLDTNVVDERGGLDNETSDFGLERIHGSYKLGENLRLHAGYDIWFVGDPAGLTYGDDSPGFWLDGDYGAVDFSVAYFKLSEYNWDVSPSTERFSDSKNEDRDLYAGYLNYNLGKGHDIRGFYMFDRIRDVPTGSILQRLTGQAGAVPDTNAHYLGGFYEGKMGLLSCFVEGVYKFGEAEDTGLARDDYDISAYALSADLELNLDEMVGFGFKPHLGFIYTSGDDDPADGDLEGYTGVATHQRFTKFGGENTIIGDGHTMLGSVIYSFIPGLYGSGTPVITGGLTNTTALGAERGDNPGMTMTSAGLTLAPKRFLIYRTNVNSFWWNEDIRVPSFVNPAVVTPVDSGYTGTEWDNEITLAMSRHSFIKAHGSIFFPGEVIEDVTSARSSVLVPGDGPQSDDPAYRLGMEFIWNF
jgi:hypothetical protein